MTFKITLDPKVEKFLDKLEKNIALRIIDKLEELSEDPFRYLEHFEGEGYKLRVGDYRAVVDVDFNKNVLIVRVLDKRGRIYD